MTRMSTKCNASGGLRGGQFVYCERPRGHAGQHGAAPGGELVTWTVNHTRETRVQEKIARLREKHEAHVEKMAKLVSITNATSGKIPLAHAAVHLLDWERISANRREIHKLSEPLRIFFRAHRRWHEDGQWLELEYERVRALLARGDYTPAEINEARTRPAKLPPARARDRKGVP